MLTEKGGRIVQKFIKYCVVLFLFMVGAMTLYYACLLTVFYVVFKMLLGAL